MLPTVSFVAFATALFARAVDPIIVPIGHHFAVDPANVALLSTAFAIPYAAVQPVLGPAADSFGKTRVMRVCLVVLVVTGLVCALATSFVALATARIISGMAAGGIFPVSLALIGDVVPIAHRQVALARYLVMVISGNFLGAALSGVLADVVGWRGVFVAITACGGLALLAAHLTLREAEKSRSSTRATVPILSTFLTILRSRRARICYSAVFFEGTVVLGLFPYVGVMLLAVGERRAAVVGLVIGGFALGGVLYSLIVGALLRSFTQSVLMASGSLIGALALVSVATTASWPAMMIGFGVMGFGFYTLHGSIQVQATELAPATRGAAMSLHSFFFFLGQAVGPVFYALALTRLGRLPTSALAAVVLSAVGLTCAAYLRDPRSLRA